MRPPPLRITAAFLASVAGMAIGHAVVYSLAPLSHSGTAALEVAGHSHWPLPWQPLPVVLLVAVALHAAGAGRRRAGGAWSLARPLAAIQSGGFLALEASERIVVLGSAAALLSEPVVLVGLAIQVVVALAIAGLLTAGAEVVRGTTRHRRVRRHEPPVDEHARVLHLVPAAVRPGRAGLSFRGPPLLT